VTEDFLTQLLKFVGLFHPVGSAGPFSVSPLSRRNAANIGLNGSPFAGCLFEPERGEPTLQNKVDKLRWFANSL